MSRVVGGTHRISERMADDLGDRVRLNTVVRTISQNEAGVTVDRQCGSSQQALHLQATVRIGVVGQQPAARALSDQSRLRGVHRPQVLGDFSAIAGHQHLLAGFEEILDALPGVGDQAGPRSGRLEYPGGRREAEAPHEDAQYPDHHEGDQIAASLRAGYAVAATDGNVDPVGATRNWTVVDMSGPDTEVLTGPEEETTETSATFTFEGFELLDGTPVTHFECALDEGEFDVCQKGACEELRPEGAADGCD